MAKASFSGYNSVPSGVAGSGEAFLLGSGNTPLNILMRQDALAARNRQQAAVQKQKQEAQQAQEFDRLLSAAKLDVNGYLPFKQQIDDSAQRTRAQINALYHNPSLSQADKKSTVLALAAQHNSTVDTTNQIGKRLEQIRQTALPDARYNKQALTADLYSNLKGPDDSTVEVGKFNPDRLNTVLTNPKNYDPTQVVKKWLTDTLAADQTRASTAARPGRLGHTQQAASNFFMVENGRIKLDAQTHQPIPRTELPEVQLAAESDPFMKGLLDLRQSEYKAQLDGVMQKMQNYEPLTPQEKQLVGQESLKPKTRTDLLNELLIPHAYQRTSDTQTYARPLATKAPKAAPTQPQTEVSVTPTVGYQVSTYAPAAQGRMQQMGRALGITPATVTNHYPTVGVSFASGSKSYADVMIDNRGAEVVGQDGKTTALASGNGKVPMQVVSRDFVLYVNGKRLGRKEPFTSDADAFQHLLRTIDSLTPEQARKAELRAEYRGTLTDKAKTAYDGAGGQARAASTVSSGGPIQSVGSGEERLSVIVPANQVTDTQLQRASGNKWNPQQPTPQQAQAIEALQRKGGRVVTPYQTTEAPKPTNNQGKTVGSKDVLGFGAASDRAAGTKPSGVDWGRGGKYYQAGRSNTGGLY